jgi:3-oxoacyl-[acyl-carrier protein] reductase
MQGRFTGKKAIVTGAGSGIGRRIAERLAAERAAVLLADIDATAGEALEREISQQGGCAAFLGTDVRRGQDCRRMVETAAERWGGLDVLVNSAGVGDGGPMVSLPEAVWDRVMEVNLKGIFLCCQAGLPALAARGGGAIVNVASLAGLVAVPGFGPYAASKAGVIQLTRVIALEGAPQQVRANAVCPVWIDTPLLARYLASAPDAAAARRGLVASVPLGRLGTVDDVASAALYLASDEAAFITGVALPIDGGALCR